MRVGDLVVCVDNLPERSNPRCTPLIIGKTYVVLGVRDAGLKPPKNIDQPDELKIVPGDTKTDKLEWWYLSTRFKLYEGKPL